MREVLKKLLPDAFISVCWTHKIQEKQAEIFNCMQRWLQGFNYLFAACATIGSLSAFTDLQNKIFFKFAFAICIIGNVLLSEMIRNWSFNKKAVECKEHAAKLFRLREEFKQLLLEYIYSNASEKELVERFNILNAKRFSLSEIEPQTYSVAEKKAEKALFDNEKTSSRSEEAMIDKDVLIILRKNEEI